MTAHLKGVTVQIIGYSETLDKDLKAKAQLLIAVLLLTKVHVPCLTWSTKPESVFWDHTFPIFFCHFRIGTGNFPESFCQEIKVFYMGKESVALSSKKILG